MALNIKDPGIGYATNENAKGFINKDGSPNIKHLNRPRSFDDLYTYLIAISWPLFFFLVFIGFIGVNLFFAALYSLFAPELIHSKPDLPHFVNAFFLSAQTITTVGYGSLSPSGFWVGLISSFEALVGLLSFSFVTGLLYGRFSKPKAAVRFSDNMVLNIFNGQKALMFRLMSKRANIMIEPEVRVTLTQSIQQENGEYKRAFYLLNLERNQVNYLPSMWTLVHTIDDNSPFFGKSFEEIKALNGKVYVMVKYFEKAYAQQVYQLHYYDISDALINKKFVASYDFDDDGFMVVDHNKLNETIDT